MDMQPQIGRMVRDDWSHAFTIRDALIILFRQWRVLVAGFVAILLGASLFGGFKSKYESKMKILVRRERADPLMSAQPVAPTDFTHSEIGESELNSEIEVFNSEDLLRKAVIELGLQNQSNEKRGLFHRGDDSEEARIRRAVARLGKSLTVEPLRKSDVISVSYASSNPEQAVRILDTIARLYIEKHLEVHRPVGEYRFFDEQTEKYRQGLHQAEQQLKDFTQQQGVVSAQLERDTELQRQSEIHKTLAETQAAVAEDEHRVATLRSQLENTPPRITTGVKTASQGLLEQMKASLLAMKIKRTEMLSKFEPTYRPVQDLEKQIADTEAALAREEASPMHEVTTDLNPTYEWIKSDLARVQAELAGLKAKAGALNASLTGYQSETQALQQAAIEQQGLLREAKAKEDNYLMYLRKQEEARMNEALDQRGILNVAVVQQPTISSTPVRSGANFALISLLLASVGGIGLAFLTDFFDPSLRTPDELAEALGWPVLAALPKGEV